MPIQMPDYLADLDLKKMQRPPIEILREAAERLKSQTGGRVEGAVFTLNPGGGTMFRYTFYLLVPSLNDYTDPLFYAWHDRQFYPVSLMRSGGKQGKDEQRCEGVEEFEAGLGKIFTSVDTRQRIEAMIALAGKEGR